jgi:hypothetical protein
MGSPLETRATALHRATALTSVQTASGLQRMGDCGISARAATRNGTSSAPNRSASGVSIKFVSGAATTLNMTQGRQRQHSVRRASSWTGPVQQAQLGIRPAQAGSAAERTDTQRDVAPQGPRLEQRLPRVRSPESKEQEAGSVCVSRPAAFMVSRGGAMDELRGLTDPDNRLMQPTPVTCMIDVIPHVNAVHVVPQGW